MADRFLIAPYDKDSGLRSDLKPWLIPDSAFSTLENAYVFRGRVRKRFGSRWFANNQLLSRFRIQVGAVGELTPNTSTGFLDVALADATFPLSIGQGFSISSGDVDIFFTIIDDTPGDQNMLRTDNSNAKATFNFSDYLWDIEGIPFPNGTPVYFYPNLPVMGLLTFENNSQGNDALIGFDTRYAYQYSTGWDRLSQEAAMNTGAAVWTGADYEFFWPASWSAQNAYDRYFFVTNFNKDEPNFMRYYDGTKWYNFKQAIDGTNFLISAQMLVVFKNRLIALNTWEGTSQTTAKNYSNRCRYAQVGDPTSANAWRADLNNGVNTNAIDAATTEAIVSSEFIKDRLIVYFERSTWELAYTGNQAYPFTWQKINTELGAESPFSTVPFDKVVLGISQVGVHACNGANTDRIDGNIPDEVFEIDTLNNGVLRVYGIRDFFVEQAYWTFPDSTSSEFSPYPNRVLVFNYKTGTWGINDDTITVFGYYQPITGILWSDTTVFWYSDTPWNSGAIQSQSRQVVAGNHQGFTFFIDTDCTTNALVLPITNITTGATIQITVINHNLAVGDFILINETNWTDNNYLNGTIFQITNVIDANNFLISPYDTPIVGTYIGGGVCGRVSKLNIVTKEYNFYTKDNRNIFLQRADFMVTTTPAGQMVVNYFASTSTTPLLQQGNSGNVTVGTGNLDTFAYSQENKDFGLPVAVPINIESNATRVWHPVYLQGEGEVVQLQLTMTDEQMLDLGIAESNFELHAMILTCIPTSSRLQ